MRIVGAATKLEAEESDRIHRYGREVRTVRLLFLDSPHFAIGDALSLPRRDAFASELFSLVLLKWRNAWFMAPNVPGNRRAQRGQSHAPARRARPR
jgi:hypothetical protein